MKKHQVGVLVEKNAVKDKGNGVISFPNGLVITDNTEQRNGTQYDIETMDVSEYAGQVTADHRDTLDHIIASVKGVVKTATQVTINEIHYLVKESPLARLAYNLAINSDVPTNFSIETIGPWPGEEGIYYHAKLVGLSQVVLGNNKSATINTIVRNSIEQSKEDGLDVHELEESLLSEFKINQTHTTDDKSEDDKQNNSNNKKKENEMTFVTIKNSRDFALSVKYKNAAGDEVETELKPGASVDVNEEQKDSVEKQINDATAPKTEKKEEVEKTDNGFAEALKVALAPLQAKMDQIEQNAFDKKAIVPEFRKAEQEANQEKQGELAKMGWKERHNLQINAAWDLLKRNDHKQADVLNQINELHLAELKKEGKISNSMTISDFGNFVISRELLTEIEGCRNDYTALINATSWKETLSTQFAWLKRSGDINMTNVEFCDDGANGNLKPISEYSASIETSDLEELAAVTPVCNAATRFLAADLLGDVAAGYRNDYDRKRAQLVIARLEQAVEENGNSVIYDVNPQIGALTAWVDTWSEIATCTPNGTFIFNTSTYGEVMKQAVTAGVNGPLGSIFITGDVPTIFGRPFIVVPDDLMPTLNTAQTKVFVVDGANVTINHSVFYANLSNFTGRTSGGLQYDLSTEAAYEDNGTVKSAYQRNELVLRGSFFRGGAIKDTDQVSAILSPGVS